MLRKRTQPLMGYASFLILNLVLISVTNPSIIHAQEIGFPEEFALSTNREKTLQKLVPGTNDYYYFHCLHYLHKGQMERAEKMLESWRAKKGNSDGYNKIQMRKMLLEFESNPQQTLEFLQRTLRLKFDHQQEIPAAKRNLKNKLAPTLIAPENLIDKWSKKSRGIDKITAYGLPSVNAETLSTQDLRRLLKRIQSPDFPSLVQLIAKELKTRNSGGFGSYSIHNRLTLAQLRELKNLDSRLANDNNFVNAILFHQRPNNDVNLKTDVAAYSDYLNRLDQATESL